ncbi:uncharacterized protein LOC110440301 [Mizuhopecten yessoensis]|uniref:Phytanoyl-CoA hydroxylase-interacting protein-like n=1 Tax=Mizuhopecten yessoensis TaxID=6573 RepID=A0A210PLH2_MIZYE|nr:uncharacterized protein LOC110440301 [Mizuhopecten yessoensis]OWF37317.1 Phytanoyl-CoA hydroxylase-interacting protein-like [Mizuhopecten yessoensis]
MDIVRQFYHVTSLCKSQIISAKALIPQVHSPSHEWMWLLDSQYKEKIPTGLWFCSTLFNGILPNQSPYGEERVKIPIENVFSQLGGKVNIYQGKNAFVSGNTYVRLMLVKEGDNFACLEHMEKLNLKDNVFLKCISESQFQVPKRPIWVETFVPYEIDISEGEWDKVNKLLSM